MRLFEKRDARFEVLRDAESLSARAAELFLSIARRSVTTRGDFIVALSGGSTPKALYERLARDAADDSVWPRTQVFWSDERCVPPDDEESNYRMANEALLSRISVSRENIHRMRGEDYPETAAADYSAVVGKILASRSLKFDLILLGLGEDGHTASLFPHSPALEEREKLVAANWVEKLEASRLTFTVPLINRAVNVLFLVAGEKKREALRAVLSDTADPREYPARFVQPSNGQLQFLVDEAAAIGLDEKGS
ncbi:MAG TPA: 6-phosphogluconolactonase [Pyrinomonadaceae bacterium]|nr:6-phosphogluconolactonase [Pyrinomonadaceae bacterium]